MTDPSTAADLETVGTLRGAAVDVNPRAVGRVVGALCAAALAVGAVSLVIAGADKNEGITRLHSSGVPVEVTVTGCLGLMGGSGSNLAGYDCSGTLTMAGRRYSEAIPGSALLQPGSKLRVIAVPGDPALMSTVGALKSERASMDVYAVPAGLLTADVVGVGAVLWRRRRQSSTTVRADVGSASVSAAATASEQKRACSARLAGQTST